jgi:hypothetical protein
VEGHAYSPEAAENAISEALSKVAEVAIPPDISEDRPARGGPSSLA